MKVKKIFLSAVLFLFFALLPTEKVFADLPEASVELAKMYVTYDYDRPFFISSNRDSQAAYQSLNDKTIANEIALMQNREIYTQAQAEKEIQKLIDAGLVPAYILTRGKYSYDGNINAVCPTINLKLRSQPNNTSRIIAELFGGEVQEIGYIAYCACSYLGEWTNSNGRKWVAVEYTDAFLNEKHKSIGWLERDYVRFVTNDNILEISRVINDIKRSSGTHKYVSTSTGPGAIINSVEAVPAETLAKEFDNNPFKAERIYKGRTIKITGKIDNITMKNGSPAIQLSFSPKILCLVANDEPLLTEIDRGDEIAIEGTVESLNAQSKSTEGITLTDCKIISME